MNALVKPHIAIDGIEIRTDAQGRFCLNDLHKASGNERKNEPGLFLSNKQTQDLVQELITTGNPVVQKNHPVSVINGGNARGTYVVKELVYSYAMWISAAFNLKVIRTFDAVATGQIQPTDPMQLLADPNLLRNALLTYSEKVIELEQKVEVMQPTVEAFDRIAKADGSFCLRDTANNLQMRQSDLIKWLHLNNWIYKRIGNAAWHGYSDKLQAGYLEHKTEMITRPDGSNKITEQVRVTPKGLTRLSKLLGNNHV
ncbi:phage antirepressor KilAC domain-containing protein [Acinetobacter soli]|uniref:phage antirepressor KilAC domain-containing protein n=1 Tax=Acinetobacter soli TaxID=487316 RepID=UPI00280CE7D2|nr:phage antirepressor KilAC domain-containing protein [Acinetobacter soli]MDQ8996306.1 phage antirepressor KilAC domain-containing protein [Acinetobacter soli]